MTISRPICRPGRDRILFSRFTRAAPFSLYKFHFPDGLFGWHPLSILSPKMFRRGRRENLHVHRPQGHGPRGGRGCEGSADDTAAGANVANPSGVVHSHWEDPAGRYEGSRAGSAGVGFFEESRRVCQALRRRDGSTPAPSATHDVRADFAVGCTSGVSRRPPIRVPHSAGRLGLRCGRRTWPASLQERRVLAFDALTGCLSSPHFDDQAV